jgi:hypothetical protein
MKQIIIGYIVSVAVAAVLLTLVFFQIVSYYSTPNHGPNEVLYVWVIMGFWTIVLTIVPALILIYFAEKRKWRSLIPYGAAGALLATPVGLYFEFQIMLECMVIGAIAGLVFWAIAGRKAGLRDKAVA